MNIIWCLVTLICLCALVISFALDNAYGERDDENTTDSTPEDYTEEYCDSILEAMQNQTDWFEWIGEKDDEN